MARAWKISAGLVVALVAVSRLAFAENLIRNGGFEEPAAGSFLGQLSELERGFYPGTKDAPAAGWAFGGTWDGGQYTVHLSDEARSGRHSIEIRCRRKGRGGIASSPFKLMPGTILKVSFWIKPKDARGGNILLNFEGTPGDGWERMKGDQTLRRPRSPLPRRRPDVGDFHLLEGHRIGLDRRRVGRDGRCERAGREPLAAGAVAAASARRQFASDRGRNCDFAVSSKRSEPMSRAS